MDEVFIIVIRHAGSVERSAEYKFIKTKILLSRLMPDEKNSRLYILLRTYSYDALQCNNGYFN